MSETFKEFMQHGCTDGACIIARPKGMHTNGGCRCARELQRFGKAGLRAALLLRERQVSIAELEAEIARLKEGRK